MSFSILALTTVGSYTLSAQQQTDNVAAGWLDRATLSGDWSGARTSMEDRGISFSAHFVTESATNPVGGFRQTARYTQQIDFGADLDLSRLAGDSGGKIQILLLDRAGRSLSADAIGNQFAVQELNGAGQNFRLDELNYEQSLFANKLSVHLGWAPAGNYFASLPVFCDFQNGFILGIISKPRELLIIEVTVFLLVAQALVINRLAGLPYPMWNAAPSINPVNED